MEKTKIEIYCMPLVRRTTSNHLTCKLETVQHLFNFLTIHLFQNRKQQNSRLFGLKKTFLPLKMGIFGGDLNASRAEKKIK